MYAEESLREELIKKLEKEQAEYLNEIRNEGVDVAIEKAYEITSRQEIMDYLSFSNIAPEDIKVLLNTENVLGIFYDEWLDYDGNFYETLEYPIQECLENLSDDFYNKDNKDVEQENSIKSLIIEISERISMIFYVINLSCASKCTLNN